MQIQFHETEGAQDILSQTRALLCYQETLLNDYNGEGGVRLDGKDVFGAIVFNQLLQAMVEAAKDRIDSERALKAVNEA